MDTWEQQCPLVVEWVGVQTGDRVFPVGVGLGGAVHFIIQPHQFAQGASVERRDVALLVQYRRLEGLVLAVVG